MKVGESHVVCVPSDSSLPLRNFLGPPLRTSALVILIVLSLEPCTLRTLMFSALLSAFSLKFASVAAGPELIKEASSRHRSCIWVFDFWRWIDPSILPSPIVDSKESKVTSGIALFPEPENFISEPIRVSEAVLTIWERDHLPLPKSWKLPLYSSHLLSFDRGSVGTYRAVL